MNAPDATSQQKSSKELSIAFQGAPGAYSHVAGRAFLSQKGKEFGLPTDPDSSKDGPIVFSSSRTFLEVFDKVGRGSSQFGVIPLANSSVGAIQPAWELILVYQVSFVADIYIPVHHHLIGLPNTDPKAIKLVISHPVALKQCQKFISQNLSWAQAHGFWDTAGAVFHVKEKNDPKMVAIAGEPPAKIAGLSILAKDIQDFTHNETRFGVIAPVSFAMDAMAKNFPHHPRLSCCVELDPERVEFSTFIGATIGKYGGKLLNLVPLAIPERVWQNRYVLELELTSQQQTQNVWAAIRDTASKARILGIYGSLRV